MPEAMQIRLTAMDRFMLMHDRYLRKITGRGNVCVLSFKLEQEHTFESLDAVIKKQEIFRTVYNLRLKGNSIVGYNWVKSGNASLELEKAVVNGNAIEPFIASVDIDPFKSAPINFFHLNTADGKHYLLFFWHHALMDAHGAEYFVSALFAGQNECVLQLKIDKAQKEKFSWMNILKTYPVLKEVKNHIFKQARGAVHYLALGGLSSCRYRHIEFSKDETEQIDRRAADLNVELYKSSYYLYALASAYRQVFDRGEGNAYFVPMPRDLRRNFKSAALLGNQISIIFMRVQSDSLKEINEGLDDIIKSAQAGIANGMHRKCIQFFDAICFLPNFIYKHLIDSPTQGRQASFYFSDTGESLSKFKSLLNKELTEVRHYPPHFCPPGLSIVFSRFDGRLSVALVYKQQLEIDSKIEQFEKCIKEVILGA